MSPPHVRRCQAALATLAIAAVLLHAPPVQSACISDVLARIDDMDTDAELAAFYACGVEDTSQTATAMYNAGISLHNRWRDMGGAAPAAARLDALHQALVDVGVSLSMRDRSGVDDNVYEFSALVSAVQTLPAKQRSVGLATATWLQACNSEHDKVRGLSIPPPQHAHLSPAASAATTAAEAVVAGDLGSAVDTLCAEDGIRIPVTKEHRKAQQLPPGATALAMLTLRVCGVVVLDDVMPMRVVRELRWEQALQFEEFQAAIGADPSAVESPRSSARSDGRYELQLSVPPAFTTSDGGKRPVLSHVVDNALLRRIMWGATHSSRIEVDTFSSVTSLGNTPAQHWHQDTPTLHRGRPTNLTAPTHGVVMFVPLVDVSNDMGPTMFLAGSHLDCPADDLQERRVDDSGWMLPLCSAAATTSLRTPGRAGSAVLFDVRVTHAGGANRTPLKRPMVYVSFFTTWYTDDVNWAQRQTQGLQRLEPSVKALMRRVDHRLYVERLEQRLAELGVDVAELSSMTSAMKHLPQA